MASTSPEVAQAPHALSRVGSRAQHCLQSAGRRRLPGASGTAAQRRSVSGCLGARRIPDPTTAGDFCRRFAKWDIHLLQETFNEARLKVWRQQPESFFEEAIIDGDGTMAETHGECKAGMDINHEAKWGYHPLLIPLANTAEPLYLLNRSGNRPSHEAPPFISIRPSPCVVALDSARSRSAATPTSRRRSVSMAGTKRGSSPSASTPCRTSMSSRKACRKTPGNDYSVQQPPNRAANHARSRRTSRSRSSKRRV